MGAASGVSSIHFLEVDNNAESPSGPSAVGKEIFSDKRDHFVQIERRKTQPKL